jgi:hypothetical protein
MPSPVKAHLATRAGRRYRVRSFTRYGPEHSAKWKRLVRDLKRQGNVKSPEAVATAVLGFKGTYPKSEQRKILREHRVPRGF